ncbi:aminoglycoside phosphotransferase family protein [Pseudoruegeria sp. SHC-113]|uniref:aminoglycoside phosphotransferase family protein n=1 Tax=Pseudoruegeria sp. SHC-113 TaxID=2855439 RepID=UPI0021BB9BB1|nr:aminoglycoside phosphotransferase family protein [Pseudoruegeria sp. SHC-113]MCT8161701.1 aminoglycoside phosphotransferase family protein [Pseudoruegeria sp. SHC-113]
MQALEDNCARLAQDLGLADRPEAIRAVEPLTGGVASDIARVRIGDADYCMKFALPKLKVAADWRAPVHRNAAEYAWLTVAAKIAPESAVRLYGRSETLHGFAMEFLAGQEVYLWKDALLQGQAPKGEAAAVGGMLGRLHAASAMADFDRSPFHNRDDFRALRIEPYIEFTAGRHADLAAPLQALANSLYSAEIALVHGDVSPKNILFRTGGPVILDAECATMGDPAFDVAFCLNHLVLKALHLPACRAAYLQEAAALWAAYAPHVRWEPAAGLEARIAALLPALMLARVDGKSPVEYLAPETASQVRDLSKALILAPQAGLSALLSDISEQTKEQGA